MSEDRQVIDDLRLARLVDGELTGDEYRQTLRKLESDDGWRRCALAFLESQAWRQAVPSNETRVAPDRVASASRDPAQAASAGARHVSAWKLTLATAASFLLAFALGLVAQPFFAPPVDLAERSDAEGVSGAGQVASPQPTSGPARMAVPQETDRHEAPPSGTDSASPGSVRLVVDDGRGGQHEMQLPVRGLDQAMRQPQTGDDLPPQLVEMLRQSGHDLQRRQHWIPVALEDGSQLVIPVEQMRIVPVSRRGYQ